MKKWIILSLLLIADLARAQSFTGIGGTDALGKQHPIFADDAGSMRVLVVSDGGLSQPGGPTPYSTQLPVVTGSNGYGAGSADFNSDGNPDIVLSNSGGSNVTLYFANADGSLQPGQSIAVGNSPRLIAVADYDGDGCPEFAVANYTDGSVSVFLNSLSGGKCTGVFTLKTTIATGLTQPQAIAAGAFGDNVLTPGIVVASRAGTAMKAYPGNGDGTFGSPTALTGPNSPYQIALYDMNNDGALDIVAIGEADQNVGVIFGTTGGGWGSFVVMGRTLNSVPSGIAVADFNGDQIPDVAISDAEGLDVFIGNNGGFAGNEYALNAVSYYPYSVAANEDGQGVVTGDFNADGYVDIAVAVFNYSNQGNGIVVFSGNGTGRFVQLGLLPTLFQGVAPSTNPFYPITADLNHDSHPDFIVPSYSTTAAEPAMILLYSSAIAQVAPALGTVFYVSPSPGTNFSGSKGPEIQSTANCKSAYATFLGTATSRTSVAIQPQYETGPVWIGGPEVTTCPGCPYSLSDAGFVDGGPGIVGEWIAPGGYLSKDLGTAGGGLFCIKATGAEDGTRDGGWTVVTELP